MKILIASDIHGSAYYAQKLYDIYLAEKPNYIFLLGDYLYHGPINDVPEQYDAKKTVEILNKMKDKIIAVYGNCDSDVDKEVLGFSIKDFYRQLVVDDIKLLITHGNQNQYLPRMDPKTVLITGHTHVYEMKDNYINPGSISLPREKMEHTYILYEKRKFVLYNVEGKKLGQLIVDVKNR